MQITNTEIQGTKYVQIYLTEEELQKKETKDYKRLQDGAVGTQSLGRFSRKCVTLRSAHKKVCPFIRGSTPIIT